MRNEGRVGLVYYAILFSSDLEEAELSTRIGTCTREDVITQKMITYPFLTRWIEIHHEGLILPW